MIEAGRAEGTEMQDDMVRTGQEFVRRWLLEHPEALQADRVI